MRLAIVTLAAVGATAASAALAVQPGSLVLRSADVPAGFVLDREASGIRTNADEGGSDRKSRALIARLGRITGYQSEWHRGAERDSIVSRADVFRTKDGARRYVDLAADSLRASGIKGLRKSVIRLGDEAYVFHGGPTGEIVWVVWRSGRVAGTVVGWGVQRAVTLSLSRTQQRRIAAATD
jgi:hypothetical protein